MQLDRQKQSRRKQPGSATKPEVAQHAHNQMQSTVPGKLTTPRRLDNDQHSHGAVYYSTRIGHHMPAHTSDHHCRSAGQFATKQPLKGP